MVTAEPMAQDATELKEEPEDTKETEVEEAWNDTQQGTKAE